MSSLPIPTSRGLRPRRRLRTDEGELVDYRVGRASASGCVSPVARCSRFVDCAPPALARTATQARYAACHCAVAPWWIAQLSRSLEGCGLDDKEADEPCCAALRSSASPRSWRPLRCASWSTWATGRAPRGWRGATDPWQRGGRRIESLGMDMRRRGREGLGRME